MRDKSPNPIHSSCQNCGKTWDDSQLVEARRLWERVSPGEPMPSGECPACGALCHPIEKAKPEPRIYRIIRFRRNGRPRTTKSNLTLTEAQAHCSRDDTRKDGVWFDGYDYMQGCRPKDD